MFKLYLKKLFLIIGFLLAILAVYHICWPIFVSFANFFEYPAIRYSILIGIPAFFVLMFVYKRRMENKSLKLDYIKYVRSFSADDLKFDIRKEFNYFKTFKPLIAEAMAVTTLILPFVIGIGFTVENDASLLVNCLAGLVIFSLFVGIYLIADIAFWVLVHKNWLK